MWACVRVCVTAGDCLIAAWVIIWARSPSSQWSSVLVFLRFPCLKKRKTQPNDLSGQVKITARLGQTLLETPLGAMRGWVGWLVSGDGGIHRK